MEAPGLYNLGDVTITAALTDSVITSGVSAAGAAQALIDRLDGMSAVTIQARLAYGGGGTSIKVDIETSLDHGLNWLPIARLAFTTASALKVVNLSGLTPKTTAASPGALTDDACLDGVLGDRLRARVTSVGTYTSNTTLSVRAAVR